MSLKLSEKVRWIYSTRTKWKLNSQEASLSTHTMNLIQPPVMIHPLLLPSLQSTSRPWKVFTSVGHIRAVRLWKSVRNEIKSSSERSRLTSTAVTELNTVEEVAEGALWVTVEQLSTQVATCQIRCEDLEGRSCRNNIRPVGGPGGPDNCLTSSVSFLFMLNGAALSGRSLLTTQPCHQTNASKQNTYISIHLSISQTRLSCRG